MPAKQKKTYFEAIRDRIFERAASPDYHDRLSTEIELSKELGISRSPVRNVLAQLERERLIIRKKKKGILLRKLDVKEIVETYDARAALEGFAARLAKGKLSEKELAKLAKLAADIARQLKDGNLPACAKLEGEFHRLILCAAGNSIIAEMIERVSLLERSFFIRAKGNGNTTTPSSGENPASHEAIIEAFRRGTAEDCERLMRQHIQWTKMKVIERALRISLDKF